MLETKTPTLSVIARVFDEPSIISQIFVVQLDDPETSDLPSHEGESEQTVLLV